MSFPKELKNIEHWVCYRLIPDKDGGKPKKIPLNPITGKGAKSNDPSTWTDYQTAVDAMEQYGFTGIGFMFVKEDGYVGVDIDHCYNPETGEFNEVATAVLAKQPTYAEISPSGDGIHLWFRGVKPAGSSKNSSTGVEMYDSVRYFTVTGKKLPAAPDTLADGTDTLAWIYENYVAKKKKLCKKKKKGKKATPGKLSDEDLMERAKASVDGDSFTALWEGNWKESYQSQSEADMALCRKLAFWSGRDKMQMDRLFRQSALFRQKWDEKHHANGATYGEETLDRVIKSTESVYSPDTNSPIFEYEGQYFRAKGDNIYPITNFIFQPVEMIVSEEETQLTANLMTTRGETYPLTFMTTDFSNQQKFKALLNKNTISLSYFGSDGDLEFLKTYVSELEWTRKTGVKAMGVYDHQGRMVFVSCDGSIEKGGVDVDDIVQLDKYKSIQSGILSCNVITKDSMIELGKYVMSYNEPAKAISILAWASGCFIKQHLRKEGVKFPHLFLIGEAGSGKSTTLERVLLPIFSSTKITAATQVTQFTLMKEAASSNLIPVPLDEFKPSKIDRIKLNTLYNHFRDAYDGHEGVRGRADQTVVTYELLAPLIVAGEESADEAAIRERSIELLFSKKDLKPVNHHQAFNRLISSEQQLGEFGRALLNTALTVKTSEAKKWYTDAQTFFSKELPSRIISNLSCCYAGLKLMEYLCSNLGLTWDAIFPFSFDSCAKYLEYAAKDYLLDGGTHNQSIVEQTFEVISRMRLDTIYYDIADDKLYIRLSSIYDQYTKFRKDYAIVGEVLTYSQFQKQLKHSDLLLKTNEQHRFGKEKKNSKCWVIDYKTLCERCNVSGFDITEIEPL